MKVIFNKLYQRELTPACCVTDSDVVSPAQSPLVPRGARSNYKQVLGPMQQSILLINFTI